MVRVVVLGASGYAGGELLRLCAAHDRFTVVAAGAQRWAGEPVTAAHPGLLSHAGDRFLSVTDALAQECEVLFLALPHGTSGQLELPDRPLIVDLSADHRLHRAADWSHWYSADHPWQDPWTYGLPELPGARAALSGCRRIANPGCYPTAVALALRPALQAGVCPAPVTASVVAVSGASGAGRTPSDALLATEVMGSARAYRGAGEHQHTPEMEQSLPGARLTFTPVLLPMTRGIIAVCTVPLRAERSEAEIRAAYSAAYDDEPFVRVLAPGSWPTTAAVRGTNRCDIALGVDSRTGTLTVAAAIDNLGKGAAAQAIQNANIALGLPEGCGLSLDAVSP